MKKLYCRLETLGVHASQDYHEQSRTRVINHLQLTAQALFLVYFLIGLFLQSVWITGFSLAFMATGWFGLWMHTRCRYDCARTIFVGSSSLILLVLCNSVEIPEHFIVFHFVNFVSLALYYDLEKDVRKAIASTVVCICSAALSIALPGHLVWTIEFSPRITAFFRVFNYSFCFFVTLFYIAQIVLHINRSARHYIHAVHEAEKQRFALQQAKQQAELLASVQSRFVSNMSHELRTPLNGIIGTVQLLLQEPRLPSQKHHFDVMKFSSEHMLCLVNDVLDFSKIEAGKMELANDAFNLKDLVEKTKTIFQGQFAAKGVAFRVLVSPTTNRDFLGDETRLNQVINNLLSNAMKFTNKGWVELEVKLVEADSQTAQLRFSVRDTGIGISAEKQAQIFSAFSQGESDTTRKFGGTGLGLTISRKLVSMMGGELKLESESGKGAHFFFALQLPFSHQSRPFVNENKVGRLERLKGLRVLVAEDSHVNMVITRKFLQRWEVSVAEAQNGEQCVQAFDEAAFDLLLIDLDMPVMDGYEAVAEIRKRNANVPAIAFTAAVFPNMKQQLLEKGFDDFLQKPFRPEDLHKKLLTFGLRKTGEADGKPDVRNLLNEIS